MKTTTMTKSNPFADNSSANCAPPPASRADLRRWLMESVAFADVVRWYAQAGDPAATAVENREYRRRWARAHPSYDADRKRRWREQHPEEYREQIRHAVELRRIRRAEQQAEKKKTSNPNNKTKHGNIQDS